MDYLPSNKLKAEQMAGYAQTGNAGGLGANNRVAIPQATQVNQGSLADAFQSLDAEIGALEKVHSILAERINPALEPPAPCDPSKGEGQCRSASPLAEATFDYARRIRIVVQAMHEMSARISF